MQLVDLVANVSAGKTERLPVSFDRAIFTRRRPGRQIVTGVLVAQQAHEGDFSVLEASGELEITLTFNADDLAYARDRFAACVSEQSLDPAELLVLQTTPGGREYDLFGELIE